MSVLAMTTVARGLLAQTLLVTSPVGDDTGPGSPLRVPEIIARMEAAYARIDGYRAVVEVRIYRDNRVAKQERFVYSFSKPDKMRVDFESPHAGVVLTYPDREGKVVIKPPGWLGLVKFHLPLDSRIFRSASGQRIDQTGLGLLVQNIAHSLTDRRRGEITLSVQGGQTVIEVLADDHFLPGVETRYRFTLDESQWLPVAVREATPEGALKRDILLSDLHTSGSADDRLTH